MIETSYRVAKKTGIKLGQSYKYVVKKLTYLQSYTHHPKQWKQGKKGLKKLKRLAGRQVRDLTRGLIKLGREYVYADLLKRMERIVSQVKTSKDKLYSLHEAAVSCIAKEKTRQEVRVW